MRVPIGKLVGVSRAVRDSILANLELLKFLTALFGGILVLVQLHQALNSYKSDVQSRLISHSLEILKTVKEKPKLYDYFYYNKDLSVTDVPTDRANVEIVALMYLDLFEHICLQSNVLGGDTDISWKAWASDILDKSPVTRRRLHGNRNWYSQCVDDLSAK
jgi:hypothetical protein